MKLLLAQTVRQAQTRLSGSDTLAQKMAGSESQHWHHGPQHSRFPIRYFPERYRCIGLRSVVELPKVSAEFLIHFTIRFGVKGLRNGSVDH